MVEKDVHTEHCCVRHGCKYYLTMDDCTVVSGSKPQSFPCEVCSFEDDDPLSDKTPVDLVLEGPLRLYEPDYGPLGIASVSFKPDGSAEAQFKDGSKQVVRPPLGWQYQVVGSAIIWKCPCGALTLGVPRCESCERKLLPDGK